MKSLFSNFIFIFIIKVYYLYEILDVDISISMLFMTSWEIGKIDFIVFFLDIAILSIPIMLFNKYLIETYIITYPYVKMRESLLKLYIKEKKECINIIVYVILLVFGISLLIKDSNYKVIVYIVCIIYTCFVNFKLLISFFDKNISDLISILYLILLYSVTVIYNDITKNLIILIVINELILILIYKRRVPYDRNN